MKAIVMRAYGSPDVLEFEEVEAPVPADNEVRVRIHAASAGRADAMMRKGGIARLAAGLLRPKEPIPGAEFAGQVDAVGKDVRRLGVGDRVMGQTGLGFGSYAEYVCVPEDGALVEMPSDTTYEEAASLVEGMLTALPFIRDTGGVRSGQSVLINGASGGVGVAAVQVAKHFGANVTGVCSASSAELVKSLGADEVIDYTKEDFTRRDRSYDVIFDAVGLSSFMRCRGALAPGGIYMTTVPTAAIMLQMLWTSRFGSKKARIGFTGLRPTDKKVQDLCLIKELIEAGDIRPVIDKRYPLAQAAEAHGYIDTGHKKGNVVLVV